MHQSPTRQLANRWVGILHARPERGQANREEVAWPERTDAPLQLVA